MKKLTLLMLVLFGMGLATSSIAASSDNPTPKSVAPACNGVVFNKTPCTLDICIVFTDCNGTIQTECINVPPSGPLDIAAFLASRGRCCSGIIGVTAEVMPASPVSPIVAPGTIASYFSGVGGPCIKLLIDYGTYYPDCVIHP